MCERADFYSALQLIRQEQFEEYFAGVISDADIQFSLRRKILSSIYETINEVNSEEVSPMQTMGTIKTPRGTVISVYVDKTYSADWFMSIAEAESAQADMMAGHPSARVIVPISEATAAYNCHSYAWYLRFENNVWLEDPSAYRIDGSYISTTRSSALVVYWYNRNSGAAVHSGVMWSAGTTAGNSIIRSKWDMYGVIEHEEGDCPYSVSGNVRTYWKRNA